MSDRNYIAPLPSWGHFVVFILVFFIGIFSISMTAVSFANYITEGSISYLFIVPQFFGLCLFISSYLIVYGWSSARVLLAIFNITIVIASLVKIFFDKSDEFLLLQVSISIVSGLAFFILRSSYFKEFVAYRRRHIAVVKKARRGEILDDGEPFYREKIKDS